MGEEISLSLEETNKLRIELGLKPIVPETSSSSHSATQLPSKLYRNQEPKVNRFIDDDKINTIRKRLNKASQKILLNSGSKPESEPNWLNKVGTQTNRRRVNVSFNDQASNDEEEDDIPTLKLSHKLSELRNGRNIILTLKDKDINDNNSDDDVLEDENLTNFKKVSKNIKLRDMNKERRQKKLNLSVSSKDIDAQESHKENGGGDVLKINAITTSTDQDIKNLDTNENKDDKTNKIKVVFEDTDDEISDNGDFKAAKIKKRKVKDSKQIKKRKKMELPIIMKKVQLIDEDSDGEGSLDVRINGRAANPKNGPLDSVENTVFDIKREALENRRREMEIEKLRQNNNVKSSNQNGLIVDETSSFLTKLDSRLIRSDEEEAEIAGNDDMFADNDEDHLTSEIQHSVTAESIQPAETKKETTQDDGPSFFGGLASTLHFLQDRNVLPKKSNESDVIDKANSDEILKLKRQIESRELENETAKRGQSSGNSNKSRQVVSNIQSQLLKDYNPEINIVYKDENGNELTTKEAYKKLSQRFHGTKSNRTKQAKFNRKVQQRNKKNQSEMQSNFLDSL
mgnify:CR=1 FL=1